MLYVKAEYNTMAAEELEQINVIAKLSNEGECSVTLASCCSSVLFKTLWIINASAVSRPTLMFV